MKRIMMASITAVVVITVMAGVLIPILDDATTVNAEFVNEGVFNYGIFDTSDTYSLSYDSTNGISVNGTAISIPGVAVGTNSTQYSVIAAENFLIRYRSTTTGYAMQIFGLNSNDSYVTPGVASLTAEIDDGALSVTWLNDSQVSTTWTFNFTEMYAIVPNEDVAVMKVSSGEVYIKGDSPIYASGATTVTSWSNIFHFEGTYDDGITISSPALPDAVFTNIEWNITPVDGYDDLYKLESIEFDITESDTTVHATYSYFGVPSSVTAEKSVHFTDGENAIFNAIPVMIIIALLLGVVALVLRSRMD